MSPALILLATLAAEPAPPAATTGKTIVLSGKEIRADDMLRPSMGVNRKWYPYPPEERERESKLGKLLQKAVEVQSAAEVGSDSVSKAQHKKNLDYARSYRLRAIKELKAIDRTPVDERSLAHFLWKEATSKDAEPKEALEVLEQGAERFQGKPGYLYLRLELAKLLFFIGQSERARGVLNDTVANAGEGSDTAELFTWLGELASEDGRLDEAIAHFEKAVARYEKYRNPWPPLGLAWAYLQAGRCDKLEATVPILEERANQISQSWGGEDRYRELRRDVDRLNQACNMRPLFAQPDDPPDEKEFLSYTSPKTPEAAIETAIERCYVRAARALPVQIKPVRVEASGDFGAPRLEILTVGEKPEAWPLAPQVETCVRALLKNAPFEGKLEGELRISPE